MRNIDFVRVLLRTLDFCAIITFFTSSLVFFRLFNSTFVTGIWWSLQASAPCVSVAPIAMRSTCQLPGISSNLYVERQPIDNVYRMCSDEEHTTATFHFSRAVWCSTLQCASQKQTYAKGLNEFQSSHKHTHTRRLTPHVRLN